jgi:transposase
MWQRFKTNESGFKKLIKFLEKKDIIVLEAGNQAFRIAKYLLSNGFKNTYILNPGDLANIYNSLKKMDKEDSLKLARLAARFRIDELPTVPIPSDEIEHSRYAKINYIPYLFIRVLLKLRKKILQIKKTGNQP